MKRKEEPKKSNVKGYIIGLLACVPFLLFGAAMIRVSVLEISYTKVCTAETTGKVGEVSVKKERKRDSKRRRYTQFTYTADYTYELNGEQVSDKLVTSKKIKEGQTVKIKYAPDNPSHKYVKGYDDAGNLIPMIFGIVWDSFFILIIYCIIASLKYELSKNKRDL